MKNQVESDFANWFKQAFDALEVTPNEVAIKIGESNAKLYYIVGGKSRPGYETIRQILTAYPRLNANWLLKGQKPILHESGGQIISIPVGGMLRVPLFLTGNNHDTTLETTINLLNDDRDFSDYAVVQLTDNNMEPRYGKGMKLLARPIPQQEWEYINSGLFVVLYRTTLTVRRIKENELLTRDYLALYTDSPDAGFVYIKRDDLKRIWKVMEIVGGEID